LTAIATSISGPEARRRSRSKAVASLATASGIARLLKVAAISIRV
jgi:hypothetical protein